MYRFDDWATADAVIVVEEKSLEKLFETAGIALENLMVDGVDCKEKKEIHVSSNTVEGLMFSWLNELIYLKDAENFFFKSFDVKINGNELVAVGCGEKFNSRMKSKHDVKSCTYHKLKIEKNDGWKAQIVVDL